ncbi:MAG TPA: hypothetical protein VFR43_11260 [Gaiellaceae bacterium]|nr:hypothetical protein [Gaiellaceae bacterium]
MPVIEVSALPQRDEADTAAAAAAVTEAAAALLGEEPRGTWVVWRTIEPGLYAEGDLAPAVQPPATHPPLVEVVAYEERPPELVERILVAVAETLARELRLERGNVFVRWVEATAGRLHTGGRVAGTA